MLKRKEKNISFECLGLASEIETDILLDLKAGVMTTGPTPFLRLGGPHTALVKL